MVLDQDCIFVETDAAGGESHRSYLAGLEGPVADMSHPETAAIRGIVAGHRAKGSVYFAVTIGGRPRAVPESYFKKGVSDGE